MQMLDLVSKLDIKSDLNVKSYIIIEHCWISTFLKVEYPIFNFAFSFFTLKILEQSPLKMNNETFFSFSSSFWCVITTSIPSKIVNNKFYCEIFVHLETPTKCWIVPLIVAFYEMKKNSFTLISMAINFLCFDEKFSLIQNCFNQIDYRQIDYRFGVH